MNLDPKYVRDVAHLAKLMQGEIDGYSIHGATQKADFHRTATRVLKVLAKLISAPAGFQVRSNKGGPAVSGEITLHTETLYIQVGAMFGKRVMWRRCSGLKDYTGGANNWASVNDLASPDFIRKLRQYVDYTRENLELAGL